MTRYTKATLNWYLSLVGYSLALSLMPDHPYWGGFCLAFFAFALYCDARLIYDAGVQDERGRLLPWVHSVVQSRAREIAEKMQQETTDKP